MSNVYLQKCNINATLLKKITVVYDRHADIQLCLSMLLYDVLCLYVTCKLKTNKKNTFSGFIYCSHRMPDMNISDH